MECVGNATETMKAARRKRLWPLAFVVAFAGSACVYLLSRLTRRRARHYEREADYAAGLTLWTEGVKAQQDAAKVFVLLVPAVAAVTVTFLADVFDPSSLRRLELLYIGWVAFALAWIAALATQHSGRQVAYAVGQHLIHKHFDPEEAEAQEDRSQCQSWWATRWMWVMYLSVFVGLVLVACFVGVNIGEGGEERVKGEPVVTHLQVDRVDQDSVELALGLRLPGEGELYTGYVVLGDDIVAQIALVSDPTADETRSLSFRLDEVDPSAGGAFFMVPASLQLVISEPEAVEAIRANLRPLVKWSGPQLLPTPMPR